MKWTEFRKFRRQCLTADNLEEVHGWIVGLMVAIERLRKADQPTTEKLIAALRQSVGPKIEDTIGGAE